MAFLIFLYFLLNLLYLYSKWLGTHSIIFGNSPAHRTARDWDWKPKVSVMLACFNEGKVVCDCVDSIMNSDYPKDKIEIIACDDCSPDDSYQWLLKLQEKYPNNLTVRRNEYNLGKPFTIVNIFKETKGEIVISIDSDTIFDKNAIKEIMSCYADPEIGTVGAQVRILNLNDSIWTQMQAFQYATAFYLIRTVENQCKVSRCLSGPLVSFRREIFAELVPLILKRNFLSIPIIYGEDTYMTTCISVGADGLSKKWKAYTNLNALAWTGTPATTIKYLNQQIRWKRGGLGNGIFVLGNLFKHCMRAGVTASIITTIQSLQLISVLPVALALWISGNFLVTVCAVMYITAAYGFVSSLIYNLLISRNDMAGKIKNPMLAGLLHGVWTLISMYIPSFFAMWTLDDQSWVTRQNAERNTR